MKFNPFEWEPVKAGETYSAFDRVQIRATGPVALIVYKEGVEAVAGFAPVHDVEISGCFDFEVEGDARVFARKVERPNLRPSGEVFTNIDRMPMESGTVSEIARQVRMFKLEQQKMLRDMRAMQSVKKSPSKAIKEDIADEQEEPEEPQKENSAKAEKADESQ